MRTYIELMQIYLGSDGDATKALYAELGHFGPAGDVGINLFRACKTSERAKKYRGGGYRGMAYEKKNWSIENLCRAMEQHSMPLGLRFGWGRDDIAVGFENVLYVDLPTGQVSFHSATRATGPDYPFAWDGQRGQAPHRICTWIARLFDRATAPILTESPGEALMNIGLERYAK